MTNHTTSLRLHKRGPFLDSQSVPVCDKCGDLGQPMDRDEAKKRAKNHESYIASTALAATVASQPTKEKP